MKVKWTESPPLSSIPEIYWDEDLSLMDRHYQGEVIDSNKTFMVGTCLLVACDDGKIREVNIKIVEIIGGSNE